MISKALVTGSYQRLPEEIGRLGVDLTVVSPPSWKDSRGVQVLEANHSGRYRQSVLPIRFNGHYHLYHFAGLAHHLDTLRPDLLHLDEEAYNLATYQGVRWAVHNHVPAVFISCQNLYKRYPPPFRWFERQCFAYCSRALAGTATVGNVLLRKGYPRGQLSIVPQMGTDTRLFSPAETDVPGQAFTVGYAGGLLPEKGLDVLFDACAGLPGDWTLTLAGSGEAESRLRMRAQRLGILDRTEFRGRLASRVMPAFYRSLSVLVLPSLSTAGWQEQFGRVLTEAMACAVPVVVSDSGESRHTAGEAGLVYPERDTDALRSHLARLQADPEWRRRLGRVGRRRVEEHFSMECVAQGLVETWQQSLADARS